MQDLEDDIAADIRSAMGGEVDPAPVEPVEASAPAVETSAEERARDEKGRFAPKDQVSDEATEKVVAQPQERAQLQPQAAPEPPPGETIQPPHSLSAAVKAVWPQLPKEAQQEYARLEESFQKGKAEWAQKAEKFNRYEELVSPHRNRLSLAGTDEFRYVQGLITADEMLRGPNASQALGEIARMYGLNVPQANPQDAGRPQWDPSAQVLPQVAALQQQLQNLVEDKENAAKQQALSEVETFRNAKDETGNLRHLYFDNVKDLMHALLSSGQAESLEDAYERAARAHPEVWKLMQPPKAAPPPGKPAGKQITGAPAPGSRPNGALNGNQIEDDVRSAFRELSGGV